MTDDIPEDELNIHGEGSSNEVISSGETICDDIVDILKKFVTRRHDSREPANWAYSLACKLKYTSKDRIVQIVQINPNPTEVFYIVMDTLDILTSQVIRQRSTNSDFLISYPPTNQHVVTISDAIKSDKNLSKRFIVSTTLQAPDLRLHIQFEPGLTISLQKSAFVQIMAKSFTISYEAINSLPIVSKEKTEDDLITHLCARLDCMEDFARSILNAYDRTRRVLRSMIQEHSYERDKNGNAIHDIRERLGPLHEEIIRLAVTTVHGIEYGLPLEVRGLSGVIDFVGVGLGMNTEQRKLARSKLISKLVRDKSGKENAVNALVDWIDKAKQTTDWESSGFGAMIKKCDNILTSSIGKDALENSVKENDDFALILLWFEADRNTYTPPQNSDFQNWSIPTHRLEFDHRGVFKKATTSLWLYDGGESKASFKHVSEAQTQLLRRFCLFDVIARLAYKVQVLYTGKIFVPKMPEDAKTTMVIELPWKQTDNTTSSDSSNIEDILTDQRFCHITVSSAPVCLSEI